MSHSDRLPLERDGIAGFAARLGLPRIRPYEVFAQLIMIFIILIILFPIGRMIVRTFVVDGNPTLGAFAVLGEHWVLPMLANTAIAIGLSTVLAVAVGALLAWLQERTDAKLGLLGSLLPVIPLVMPSLALAIGWVFLAGPRVSLLNGLIADIPYIGADGLNFKLNIYTWTGLIWVYVIHGVPYAYLVVSAALKQLDPALEEASQVSGAGLLRTLWRVSLPSVKPALIASALLATITSVGLYSIPAIIATRAGIDLYAVRLVHFLTRDYPPDIDKAQAMGIVLFLVVGALWVVQTRVTGSGRFIMSGGKAAGSSRLSLGRWRVPARVLMIGYILLSSILPMLALAIVALQPFWKPDIHVSEFTLKHFANALYINPLTSSSLRNSLALAAVAATAAMVIAIVAAIQLSRHPSLQTRFVDAVIKAPATIPNLITALAFLVTFSGPPFYLNGTLILLLLAYTIVHVPSGSIAANSAVAQVGSDLREASYIAGAGEGRTIMKVVIPLAIPGFAVGWMLVFVHTVGDVNASALLAGVNTPVVSYAILGIWENGVLGLLAAFSTILCLVIILVIALVSAMVHFSTRYR